MPPPPPSAINERLAKLHNAPPVIEVGNAAAVTTHIVWAMVAGDEEWQSFYGASWGSQAELRMETADDQMYTQFGIDFRRFGGGWYGWTSSPNTSRPICGSGGLLEELKSDLPRISGADVVVGYTNNAMSGSSHGCASVNHTIVKLHGSSTAQREYNVWTTSQHEFSHLYGAPDRYPDPSNLHTNDVMEDHYNYPNIWCTQAGYNDKGIVASHASKYD